MSTITYEIHDPIEIAASMRAVAAALEDRLPPLAFAAQRFRMDVAENFEQEKDPEGNAWEPWADSYEPYAIANNVGILRQTEELFDSVMASSRMIVTADSVFYEVDMPQRGAWHQEGAMGRRTKSGAPNPLPARPFLGLSDTSSIAIMEVFSEWFDGAIMLYPTVTGKVGMRHSIRGQGKFVSRASVGKAPLRGI